MGRWLLLSALALVSCGDGASSGTDGGGAFDAAEVVDASGADRGNPDAARVADAGGPVADSGGNLDAAGDGGAGVGLKRHYGHYFATNYNDTAADAAALCEQQGVTGINFRQTWLDVETKDPNTGKITYNFSAFDDVLTAIAASKNPKCQLWLFVEWRSYAASPTKNPCPKYLQQSYSALNADGSGAETCFMWEKPVIDAFVAMMQALAQHFDANPRVEGLILQESSLGFNGQYSQDAAHNGTYTPELWRDALIQFVNACSAAFTNSRCLSFLNFLVGNQSYLADVSAAISAVPNNQACYSGPDLLPNNSTLYADINSTYEQLTRHKGCRSNSAQNDSFNVQWPNGTAYTLDDIFNFAVSGTFGDFDQTDPYHSGVCVNSYLFWNHRVGTAAPNNYDWTDAEKTIAKYPYSAANWTDKCTNGGGAP
jgi:hypothetical protein